MKQKFIHLFICLLTVLTFTSCSTSTADLEKEVKKLFNEKNMEAGVKATKVTLVHEDGNNYSGFIVLTDGEDTEEYEINVICDGRSFQYEIPDL